jgi:protein-disulfide isomerase
MPNAVSPENPAAPAEPSPPAPARRWLTAIIVASFVLAVAAVGLSGAALMTALKNPRGPTQSIDFAAEARAYIEAHPEVIVDSLNTAESRVKESEAKAATNQLAARKDEVFSDAAAPVVGNPKGDAILVEFFDYNCPYCRKAAPVVDQLMQADPGVKVVYKEFPILGPGSTFAARAALAAQKQGKYAIFHDALFAWHGRITEVSTMEVATSVGLDLDRLKKDMADPAIETAIKSNLALAEALRITGTPTFVSGKDIAPGLVDLETLKRMITAARKG